MVERIKSNVRVTRSEKTFVITRTMFRRIDLMPRDRREYITCKNACRYIIYRVNRVNRAEIGSKIVFLDELAGEFTSEDFTFESAIYTAAFGTLTLESFANCTPLHLVSAQR